MAAAALAARVVEVIADLGGAGDSRYRYGSGCIVRGRTVLTAAHVVAGAVSVVVRDPAKREYTTTVGPRFAGDVDGPGPDLALVEIDDPAFSIDLPGIGLAAVDRDSTTGEPVERCHAVGYPWFAETRSRTRTAVRDTVDAIGVVPVMSNLGGGLLSVQVTVSPRELPPEETALAASEWSGMSGAPVFAGGCLLGVVTEHAPREGPSAITAVPLTALQADPSHAEWGPGAADPAAWWARLGVEDAGDLRRLPVLPPPRPEPEYRDTVREFGRTLHQRMPQLLGRERELAGIAAFATGADGYRWLVGGAFAGKSALLYEAVTVGLPDEVDVVCYFMSRRASDASSDRFLAAVVPQLAYLCEKDPPVANRDQYYALWQQAADRAARSGRHLLLVVDGLDEDLLPPGSPSVASLLPLLAGAHAHVLAASRPHPGLPDDVPGGHPLKSARANLEPFEGAPKLAELATKELGELTKGDDADLAVDILGLLTAAAGGLSVSDLVALRRDGGDAPTAADRRHVRRLVEDRAARILERVGSAGKERYQFAHGTLLEYAQTAPDPTAQDLRDPEYRQRIHRWAERWRDAGWPSPADGDEGTPQYLLDNFPATLAHDAHRLAELAGDIGWVDTAIRRVGVDQVLAVLRTAAGIVPADAAVAAMLAVVAGQARNLRSPGPVDQPGFAARQICLQATGSGLNDLAEAAKSRARAVAPAEPVLLGTTRRAALGRALELGSHDQPVGAVTVLGGRVVSAGNDGRLLVWDPAAAGAAPIELANHTWEVTALATLSNGRVISGGKDRRVLVWDPAAPGTPVELGWHSFDRDDEVTAVVALGDGRVISGGGGRVLLWDPAAAGAAPVELGRHSALAMAALGDSRVVIGGYEGRLLMLDAAAAGAPPVELRGHDGRIFAVAVLGDGRVVSGGEDRRLLVWDPAAPGTAPVELGSHDDWVMAVAVVDDGRVISAGSDGRVLAWDSAVASAVPKELGRSDGRIKALVALGDGRMVSGGYDGRVLVWDPAAAGTARAGSASRDVSAATVAVLADGRVVAGGKDGSVWLWDPAAAPDGVPVELGFHDDSSYLRWVGVAALGDGRVVSAGGGRVLLWDPAAPSAAPVELGNQGSSRLAVAGDRRVISLGNQRLLVWDPADVPHAVPVEFGQHRGSVDAAAVAVLRDGRLVGGGSDGTLRVWDPAEPGAAPVEFGFNPGVVGQIAVLSDGRVATGDFEGAVRLWDPSTPGAAPVELGRHNGWVNAVAVLGDGRVVSGGKDGRVRFWDPAAPGAASTEIVCSVQALSARAMLNPPITLLVIADAHVGLSAWTVGARA